jgi:hypothetical protein
MTARELLLDEIEATPENILEEIYHFMVYLKARQSSESFNGLLLVEAVRATCHLSTIFHFAEFGFVVGQELVEHRQGAGGDGAEKKRIFFGKPRPHGGALKADEQFESSRVRLHAHGVMRHEAAQGVFAFGFAHGQA